MELHLSGAHQKDNTNRIHSSQVFLLHLDRHALVFLNILKPGNTSNLDQ